MYGSNLGRALMSVGDDVMRYSGQEQAMRIAQMRDARERELAELRAAVQTELAQARAERADGGRGGIIGGTMSDEHMAALAGQTVPEFTAGRDFHRSGPQSEIKATVDTPGMEYLDPADRADLEASGGMTGETPRSMLGRQHADRSREGLVRSMVGPQHLDAFERGLATRVARERAFAPDADVPDVARRVGAFRGEPMQDIRDDTAFDRYAPPASPTSTPLGAAKARTEGAREGALRAEGRKAGGGERTENQLTPVERERLNDARRAVVEAEKRLREPLVQANAKSAAKAQADLDAAIRHRDDLLRNLTGAGFRDRTGATDATPPAAPAPMPDAPPVSMLREGVNTRFKNGQVWTLRAGRPVRVS